MTAAGSDGVGLGVEGGARRKRRSWGVAERQRIVEAALAPGGSVAGEGRQREPGLQMDPPFAGRLAGSALRCGQPGAGGDKLVAKGERNPEVCSDPLGRAAAGVADADAGRDGRRAPGLRHDPPSAARSGRWRFAFPTARKFASKEAPTARSCVWCFRR